MRLTKLFDSKTKYRETKIGWENWTQFTIVYNNFVDQNLLL